MSKRKAIPLFIIFFLSGCAFGNRISYTGTSSFKVSIDNPYKLYVIMHDQRPYVLNHEKSESFVGLQRSLYGIPYNIHTQSNSPLAADFGSLVVDTLRSQGLESEQILVTPFEKIEPRLKDEKDGRVIVFVLKEWKTDTYFKVRLKYEIEYIIYNANNQVLTNGSVSNSEILRSGYLLSNAVTSIFEKIFSDSRVADALSRAKARDLSSLVTSKDEIENTPRASNLCSIEQILSMEKMGLSKEQIQSACE